MPHWVQITSGRGPAECSWVAFRVFQEILKQAMEHGLTVDVLEMVPDTPLETCKSALLVLDNDDAGDFSGSWEGVIQWIGTSPFRPNHKRKNWFVGVRVFSPPPLVSFSEKDIRIQTMKASGPGGQHVNKTESAVRITHLPTNLTATAREERSQHLNRKLAMARLAELIKEHDQDRHEKNRQEMWDAHNSLERGNPVRIFEGARFKRKK